MVRWDRVTTTMLTDLVRRIGLDAELAHAHDGARLLALLSAVLWLALVLVDDGNAGEISGPGRESSIGSVASVSENSSGHDSCMCDSRYCIWCIEQHCN